MWSVIIITSKERNGYEENIDFFGRTDSVAVNGIYSGYDECRNDRKKMFGIDESKYTIIKKDCSISRFKEGGKIDIYLKVREDQMDAFIRDLEDYGAEFIDRTIVQPSSWDKFIDNTMLMNPEEVERFYHGIRFARRTFISYLSPPSRIYTWITISPCHKGYYDVRLWGWETPGDFMSIRAWK